MAVQKSSIRVAIVTDWFWQIRGNEKLLDAICEIYPNSEIFTLFGNKEVIYKLPNVKDKVIHFTWLNRIPFIKYFYRYTYFLWPMVVEGIRISNFDIIISLSSSVAKGILPKGIPHICYMNSPMRYAWDSRFDYFHNHPLNAIINIFLHFIRVWDVSRNNTIDYLIANSQYVSDRIVRYYGIKPKQIIYPFFNTPPKNIPITDSNYYLYHGALEPNKGVLQCVNSAVKYGFPLKVSGNGSLRRKIMKISKGYSNIEILGYTDEETKYFLMKNTKALLFPSNEDFGIVALESASLGVPVICLQQSGTSEFIKEGLNGVIIKSQNVDDIYNAISSVEKIQFHKKTIIQSVEQYTRVQFQNQIESVVNSFLESK